MFKLNRTTRTKSGERVVPYLIEGRMVHCFDKNKQSKSFDLSEFEVNKHKATKKKYNPVIIVKGSAPTPIEENLFNPNEGGGMGGIYEEKPLVVKPPTVTTKPEPDPIIPEDIVVDGSDEFYEENVIPNEVAVDTPTYIITEDSTTELSGAAAISFVPKGDLPTREYKAKTVKTKLTTSGLAPHYHTVIEKITDADDFYGSL